MYKMKIIEITKSSDKNIDTLVELLHQQMIVIGSEKTKEVICASVENALKKESRATFFVVFKNSDPIGMAFINVCSGIESEGDYIWLNEIHVKEEYRKQGTGTRLIEHIIRWAKDNNCRNILGVASLKNEASQNFFLSNGFKVSGMKWLDLIV